MVQRGLPFDHGGYFIVRGCTAIGYDGFIVFIESDNTGSMPAFLYHSRFNVTERHDNNPVASRTETGGGSVEYDLTRAEGGCDGEDPFAWYGR